MAIFGKKEKQEAELPKVLPKHVAFIMDGNGRWAKKRGFPRTLGHREGAKAFRKIVRCCRDLGIRNISFYAFSTENWQRPEEEVNTLMDIFRDLIGDARKHFGENTRMIFLGDKDKLPEDLREKMIKLEEDTAGFTEMNMFMAINYGGRDELTRSARLLAQQAAEGRLRPEDITEQSVADNLYTAGFPDVDLMIRTSGELRISNFLIWQCAYAEFYFTDVLWPDFTPDEFKKALAEFGRRQRRFGGV